MKKYSENGLWIEQRDQAWWIGLASKGQDDLGEVSFVELLKASEFNLGTSFISIEAAKAVTELGIPISGKVVRWHEELEDEPSLLNETDPMANWIVILEGVTKAEWDALLNEELPIIKA